MRGQPKAGGQLGIVSYNDKYENTDTFMIQIY